METRDRLGRVEVSHSPKFFDMKDRYIGDHRITGVTTGRMSGKSDHLSRVIHGFSSGHMDKYEGYVNPPFYSFKGFDVPLVREEDFHPDRLEGIKTAKLMYERSPVLALGSDVDYTHSSKTISLPDFCDNAFRTFLSDTLIRETAERMAPTGAVDYVRQRVYGYVQAEFIRLQQLNPVRDFFVMVEDAGLKIAPGNFQLTITDSEKRKGITIIARETVTTFGTLEKVIKFRLTEAHDTTDIVIHIETSLDSTDYQHLRDVILETLNYPDRFNMQLYSAGSLHYHFVNGDLNRLMLDVRGAMQKIVI